MSYQGRSGSSYSQIRRAQKFHARRSKRAKRIDESLKAPIAKSVDQWLSQLNRFDLPNVDTPKEKAETKQEPDKPFEPRKISRSETIRRLNYYRVCRVTH